MSIKKDNEMMTRLYTEAVAIDWEQAYYEEYGELPESDEQLQEFINSQTPGLDATEDEPEEYKDDVFRSEEYKDDVLRHESMPEWESEALKKPFRFEDAEGEPNQDPIDGEGGYETHGRPDSVSTEPTDEERIEFARRYAGLGYSEEEYFRNGRLVRAR